MPKSCGMRLPPPTDPVVILLAHNEREGFAELPVHALLEDAGVLGVHRDAHGLPRDPVDVVCVESMVVAVMREEDDIDMHRCATRARVPRRPRGPRVPGDTSEPQPEHGGGLVVDHPGVEFVMELHAHGHKVAGAAGSGVPFGVPLFAGRGRNEMTPAGHSLLFTIVFIPHVHGVQTLVQGKVAHEDNEGTLRHEIGAAGVVPDIVERGRHLAHDVVPSEDPLEVLRVDVIHVDEPVRVDDVDLWVNQSASAL
jgi:hypothetical protein